jgi:hypothetical protein
MNTIESKIRCEKYQSISMLDEDFNNLFYSVEVCAVIILLKIVKRCSIALG